MSPISTQGAGALKKSEQAIGRSRSGPTAHALVDALGNSVAPVLSSGQAGDLTCAAPLIENSGPAALIEDRAYDAEALRETLAGRQITAIPRTIPLP